MFGVVDFAAKESHARAVFLGVVDQFEGVVGRAGAAAEDADDEVRIVLRQLLHRFRPVINNLQKDRAAGLRHACQRAKNVVVDKLA